MELKGRQDRWRLILPDDIIPAEINDKYARVLQKKHSFIYKPIDFVNESIQKIEVLGFQGGTNTQQQGMRGRPLITPSRVKENNFLYPSVEIPQRNPAGPVSLIDKTLNVDFRHEAGFLNYFILFESFFYQYSRDMKSQSLTDVIPIDIMNEDGEVYSRIMLYHPLIDGMDMLSLDFTQPVATSQTFRVVFKYANLDFQFIEEDAVNEEKVDNPPTKDDYKGSPIYIPNI